MNNLIKTLQSAGLSEKEASIYLSLLKLSRGASIKDIAEGAGIKRPTAYIILDSLRQKELVLKLPGKKTLYKAEPVTDMLNTAMENLKNFERIIPALHSLKRTEGKIKTFYFEGFEGLKEALFYMLDSLKGKTINGFYAKGDLLPDKTWDLYNKYNNKLRKDDITVRGVTSDHQSVRKYQQERPEVHTDHRFIPENDYDPDVFIDQNDNFVRIVNPLDMKAVIIENPRVADAVKQIFEIVYKNTAQNTEENTK